MSDERNPSTPTAPAAPPAAGASAWAGGYPVGLDYAATLQPEMAPLRLDLVMLAKSRLPPDRGGRFRYAELGCGRGLTLTALAAANPGAEFLGVDFMPSHVAEARRFADDAGLGNIAFSEASFEELAAGPPPDTPFDYIALHGVYTWVSEENRRHIVEILRRWLAPGGIVYVGYNAMPLWSAMAPVRRLFHEVLGAGEPDPSRAAEARSLVERWLELSGDATAKAFWEKMASLPDRYLMHELGGQHGSALWGAELAADLLPAKLDFVGSADLAENFDAMRFSGDRLAFLREAEVAGFGQTARDLLGTRAFRADVFSRGAPHLTEPEVARLIGRQHVMREPARGEGGEAKGAGRGLDPRIAAPLEAALDDAPAAISDIVAASGLERRKALQAVLILLASGRLRIAASDEAAGAAAASVARFNAVARQRHADGAPLPGLAATRAGGAVQVRPSEQAALYARDGGSEELAEALGALGVEFQD